MTQYPLGNPIADIQNPLGLTDIEVASGVLVGTDTRGGLLPAESTDPRGAFEDAIRVCLERPPCVLAFSGGRDSSAVLAVALDVARREGLPQPIAVTERFPGIPESDESAWQELVIAHLKPLDWEVRSHDDEHDILGPLALDTLTRHGLLFPEQLSTNVPLLRLAGGGAFLTGHGGDNVFFRRWIRAADVLGGRVRPEPRDVLRVGLALSPRLVRRRAMGGEPRLPWLEPAAFAAVTAALRDDMAMEPLWWRRWLEWLQVQRYLQVTEQGLRILAADHDVEIGHPFLDPAFLSALARMGGRTGVSRDGAFRAVFADVLPEPVLTRTTKAQFTRVYWNRHSRAFAESWPGTGIDESLVNASRLRAEWVKSPPHTGSFLLAQVAWLRARAPTSTTPHS